jgi:hypothetical protein
MTLAHVHTARHFSFSASSDGLLLWLSEECWGRGQCYSERNWGRRWMVEGVGSSWWLELAKQGSTRQQSVIQGRS